MTSTTDTVRSQGFMVVVCDIPDGMTIAAYRARRTKRHGRARRRGRRPGPGGS
jgi:hypothetical protein